MQISQVLNNSYSNREETSNTIAIAIVDDNKIDWLLDQNTDMFPTTYRSWHAKWIKKHGDEAWVRCVSTARQEGKNPQRYLVWLLGRATNAAV